MDLYILDREFNQIGLIDTASSVIWNERYFDTGDFEIYIRANKTNIELLQAGNYVMRVGKDVIGIVEKITTSTNNDTGNYLTVTGRFLESILDRRIVTSQTTLSGRVELCIRRLIEENIISPRDSRRKIDNFILGPEIGLEMDYNMDIQITGQSLLEVITEICKNYKIGFRTVLNEKNQFVFSLYTGTDRSYGQTTNDYVVFSPEFDNLISTEYVHDVTEYKNAAVVGGEGEGVDQKTVSIGESTGLDRCETYIDSSGMSTNYGIINVETYLKKLEEYGNEQLNLLKVTDSISGEVETTRTYQFNDDFYLGDVVSVENEYGVKANTRIIEALENEDENGYKIVPTFDTWGV